MTNSELRTNLINILDDADGVSDVAFDSVVDMARVLADDMLHDAGGIDDIFAAVKEADGRFFLPEEHGLK